MLGARFTKPGGGETVTVGYGVQVTGDLDPFSPPLARIQPIFQEQGSSRGCPLQYIHVCSPFPAGAGSLCNIKSSWAL